MVGLAVLIEHLEKTDQRNLDAFVIDHVVADEPGIEEQQVILGRAGDGDRRRLLEHVPEPVDGHRSLCFAEPRTDVLDERPEGDCT